MNEDAQRIGRRLEETIKRMKEISAIQNDNERCARSDAQVLITLEAVASLLPMAVRKPVQDILQLNEQHRMQTYSKEKPNGDH